MAIFSSLPIILPKSPIIMKTEVTDFHNFLKIAAFTSPRRGGTLIFPLFILYEFWKVKDNRAKTECGDLVGAGEYMGWLSNFEEVMGKTWNFCKAFVKIEESVRGGRDRGSEFYSKVF